MISSKPNARQLLITAVTASMLAASPAFAETGTSLGGPIPQVDANGQSSASGPSFKTGFPDVPTGNWALKHITKLALEGIVQGDDKGYFRPSDNVSQQDAIIMVIRMLGLEDEAKQINADAVAIGLDVRADSKPYVIEAIDKGLLDIQEELSTPSSSGWGSRSASREWIAKVVVRAIGKQNEAAGFAGKPTSFKDNAAISAPDVGFVNVAAQYHIVEGFDDGTFKPQDTVTRAQLATMLSRSDNQISYRPERVKQGYISSADAGTIQLTLDDGSQVQYALVANTLVFNQQGSITAADLKPQNLVSVIQTGGTAYYIEVLKDTPPTETAAGVIDQFAIDTLSLTLLSDGKSQTIGLAPDVTIVDAAGKGLGLRDLTKGSTIEAKRTALTPSSKFSQIVVKVLAVNKTADGTVSGIDPSGKSITITETGTGMVTYPIAAGVALSVKGAVAASLSAIHKGDIIHYKVTANEIDSIDVVTPYVEPVDQGKLVNVEMNAAVPYISISKEDGKPPLNYLITSSTQIVIPNAAAPTLKDLAIGDDLKLDLDKLNGSTVNRITVVSRSIKTGYFRTIASYYPDKKWLTVDEDGLPAIYTLTDKSTILYSGRTYSLSDFASLFTPGKKIDLTVGGDRSVLSVKLSDAYDGAITQIDAASGKLVLTTADGQSISLKLAANATYELANVTNPSISSLKVGDTVSVTLSAAQDTVSSVRTRKTSLLRIVSVNAQMRQIVVKNDAGTAYTYTLDASIPITIGSRSAVTYSELIPDEPVLLTFEGNAVSAVNMPNTVRGRVTAVDLTAGQLTIQTADAVQTIATGAAPDIVVGGTTSNTLATIKMDDRVEVTQEPSGTYRIIVAGTQDRTIDAYDSYAKIITLKRQQLNDPTYYSFFAKAYIHHGTEPFNPNYLLPQDQVRIYTIDGKIVEMDKQ